MNRDSHNISQAYLKSRLLKEQAENVEIILYVDENMHPINYMIGDSGSKLPWVVETKNEEELLKWMTLDLKLNLDHAKELLKKAQNNLGEEIKIIQLPFDIANEKMKKLIERPIDPPVINYEEWKKEYSSGIKITPGDKELPLKYFFTQRMNELYEENTPLHEPREDELRQAKVRGYSGGSFAKHREQELLSYRAYHDIILRKIIREYDYHGLRVNNDDYADRTLKGDELFHYLYDKYFELKDKTDRPWIYSDDEDADSGSHGDEGSDDDFDDTAHDDDPTGQDEPVDTRSYSDVRTSDRLDYANRMVRSGKWDRERAEEYKRGA